MKSWQSFKHTLKHRLRRGLGVESVRGAVEQVLSRVDFAIDRADALHRRLDRVETQLLELKRLQEQLLEAARLAEQRPLLAVEAPARTRELVRQ